MAAGRASLVALGLRFHVKNKLLSKPALLNITSCIRRGKILQCNVKENVDRHLNFAIRDILSTEQ